MKKLVLVIMNRQHGLFQEQKEILSNKFKDKIIEFFYIPSHGLSLEEIEILSEEILSCEKYSDIVFVSPIPHMIQILCVNMGYGLATRNKDYTHVWVFHNDKREKKELPNGKIIQTISKTGWKLL